MNRIFPPHSRPSSRSNSRPGSRQSNNRNNNNKLPQSKLADKDNHAKPQHEMSTPAKTQTAQTHEN